jgi:hypothetical protein
VRKHHEQQRSFRIRSLRIPHRTKCIVKLIEVLLHRRLMQEPIRRHRKLEVSAHKMLSIFSWKHHTERWLEVGQLQRRVAEGEDGGGIGKGD